MEHGESKAGAARQVAPLHVEVAKAPACQPRPFQAPPLDQSPRRVGRDQISEWPSPSSSAKRLA